MAQNFIFELVSPERLLISEEVQHVVISATEGEMTVMAGHAPTMTTIKPGLVTVKRASGETARFVVIGGFADITPDGCRLLAESASTVEDFDKAALQRRIEELKAEIESNLESEARTKAEEFLGHLTTLNHTLMPL
ncbi:F0F1 ATP synthase subunit epsilon [Chelativorans composti]|jgi:ATP synthase, F1 epsilon subunit (delta in mitochondria)|uniref:ATP synthase epsilon chain n=1 Tax=Chelativorans composti TaxID=768533 RepID=A0ABW5DI43_9HYPH